MKLKPTDMDAGIILRDNEQKILDYISIFLDIDLEDKDIIGMSLYEVISIRADLNLLAEHIFDEGTGLYPLIVADEPNFFIDNFKQMIFI